MKTFMDSFEPFWIDAKLLGKKLISFAVGGSLEGGAESCLRSINAFGQHLGMINVPIPANLVPGKSMYAYGLFHSSGNMEDNRLGEDCKQSIENLVELIDNGNL